MIEKIYWYCTDFCVNSANLLGITYDEFNFLLLIIIFPFATFILFIVNIKKHLLLALSADRLKKKK